MKVEMLVSRCGPNVNDAAGDIVDVPKDEAKRMISATPPQCKIVRGKKAERAVSGVKPEKAVK